MSDPQRWFHRGKEARFHGRAREIHDARISLENRALFFSGWDEQDRQMSLQPSAEDLDFVNQSLAKIREEIARLQ